MKVCGKHGKIKVIEKSDEKEFESAVNDLLSTQKWEILSTSCGFVDSEQYDFCASYQAILGMARI